jgi:hypothetical protein
MSDASKLRTHADRIRWVGFNMTDPRDAGIAFKYAAELEEQANHLAAPNTVAPRMFWPHPGFADAQLPMLRTSLKRVFPPDRTSRFEMILWELDKVGTGRRNSHGR